MSGECNYCQGDHAEAKCDAPRDLVYENGRAAGRADGLNRVEAARQALNAIVAEHRQADLWCCVCGVEGGRWPCETRLVADDGLAKLSKP